MKISVEKAVNLIDATLQLNKSERNLPYFFIVGAGISCPEIPLAGGIVELCKNEIKKRNADYFLRYEEEMGKYETDPVKNYSGWIELAYPNSIVEVGSLKILSKKQKSPLQTCSLLIFCILEKLQVQYLQQISMISSNKLWN